MSNVFSMERTQGYLVSRAAKHRLAGRYDEAMALLNRAKEQFGTQEDVELELARTYEAMECEEEAARAYLRVMRLGGAGKPQALFRLALIHAQNADLPRAISCLHLFSATDHGDVPEETASLLYDQLQEELEQPVPSTLRGRARILERRAVERLREGKLHAARRTLKRALSLWPSAQGYTLLACCCLLEERSEEAVQCAKRAHALAPARVQALCVLTDALASVGEEEEARRVLYLCVLRAQTAEEIFGVAMQSAKHGDDRLTLRLTQALLRREPFHTRGMLLRACALTNLGRLKEASRLFGRLCGLLPENTVCEALYRMTRDGERPQERLVFGLDVPRAEGVNRAMKLISALYADMDGIRDDPGEQRALCRTCAWAFRSAMAGEHTATLALILMGGLHTEAAQEVLLDALTDPQVEDETKYGILQVLISRDGFQPYDVDMGGMLVKLAASGVASRREGVEMNQQVVQRASDALSADFPDAPGVLLPVFIDYLDVYGPPENGRHADACVAALEYVYHVLSGNEVRLEVIARRSGVSPRLCRLFVRRMGRAKAKLAEQESAPSGE